jgi:hypothetical protein
MIQVSKLRAGLAGVLIVAAALAAAAIGAAPAVAAPTAGAPTVAAPGRGGDLVCWVIFRGGVPIGEKCVWVSWPTGQPPKEPICPQCAALGLDFDERILPLDRQILINDLIVEGVGLLERASLASDPVVAAKYRAAALDRFGRAARTSGESAIAVADTGYVDARSGRFVSSPTPWLDAAARDVVTGLGLLRVAGIDPDGDPALVRQAAMRFDEAYRELSERRPIGD